MNDEQTLQGHLLCGFFASTSEEVDSSFGILKSSVARQQL